MKRAKETTLDLTNSHEAQEALRLWAERLAGTEVERKLRRSGVSGSEALERLARRAGLLKNSGQRYVTPEGLEKIALALSGWPKTRAKAAANEIYEKLRQTGVRNPAGAAIGNTLEVRRKVETFLPYPDFSTTCAKLALKLNSRPFLRSVILVTGVHGVGKTETVLAMYEEFSGHFSEGYYLDLAEIELNSPEEYLLHIKSELRQAEQLRRQLRDVGSSPAVILDNLESAVVEMIIGQRQELMSSSENVVLFLICQAFRSDRAAREWIVLLLNQMDEPTARRLIENLLSLEGGVSRSLVDEICRLSERHPRLMRAYCEEYKRRGSLSHLDEGDDSEAGRFRKLITKWPTSLRRGLFRLSAFSGSFSENAGKAVAGSEEVWMECRPWLIVVNTLHTIRQYKLFDMDKKVILEMMTPTESLDALGRLAEHCRSMMVTLGQEAKELNKQGDVYSAFAQLSPQLQELLVRVKSNYGEDAALTGSTKEIAKHGYRLLWLRCSIHAKQEWGEWLIANAEGDKRLLQIGNHLLGSSLACQGKASEAQICYASSEAALEQMEISEIELLADYPFLYSDIGWRLNDVRNYKDAKDVFLKNFGLLDKHPSERHQWWQTSLSSLDGLGNALINLSLPEDDMATITTRREEALHCFERGMELIREMVGSTPHHHTAILSLGKGESLAWLGRFAEAKMILENCHKMAHNPYWEPTIAQANHALGRCHHLHARAVIDGLADMPTEAVLAGKISEATSLLAEAEARLETAKKLAVAWQWDLLLLEITEDLFCVAEQRARLFALNRKSLARRIEAGGEHPRLNNFLGQYDKDRNEPRWMARP